MYVYSSVILLVHVYNKLNLHFTKLNEVRFAYTVTNISNVKKYLNILTSMAHTMTKSPFILVLLVSLKHELNVLGELLSLDM